MRNDRPTANQQRVCGACGPNFPAQGRKAYCSDAYVHAAQENIQIHGGIGFSWEHPAHLYFRRAKSAQMLFGTPSAHRERLADLLGI